MCYASAQLSAMLTSSLAAARRRLNAQCVQCVKSIGRKRKNAALHHNLWGTRREYARRIASSQTNWSALDDQARIAFAVFGLNDVRDFGGVRRRHRLGIPFDFLTVRPHREVAEQHGFGKTTGVIREVRHGRLAALDRVDPFLEM